MCRGEAAVTLRGFHHPLVKATEAGLSDCSQTEHWALGTHCATAGTEGRLGNLSSGVSGRPVKCRLPAGCFLKQRLGKAVSETAAHTGRNGSTANQGPGGARRRPSPARGATSRTCTPSLWTQGCRLSLVSVCQK